MNQVAATPFTWPVSSQVTLCRVAWDDSYRDVVYFDSAESRDAYFAGLESESIKLENYTYLKPNEPIRVDVPFNKAYTYNYLYVDNPKTDDPDDVTPPRFYYFIKGAAMLNPSTTALEVQLDVFQTYLWQFKFGNCFVERGHLAVAVSANLIAENAGSGGISHPDKNITGALREYCTVAESLDCGNEYAIGYVDSFDLSGKNWAVVVQSNTDLAADWGSKDNPSLRTADGQMTDGLASGCNVYAIDSWNYKEFMGKVRECPWVAKGIVSISAFPKTVLTDGPEVKIGGVSAHFLGDTPDEGTYFESNASPFAWFNRVTGDAYKHLYKLYTYPYSCIELVNYQGSSLILKPEMLNDKVLTLKQASCAAPPYQAIAFYPANYGHYKNESTEGLPWETYHRYYTMDYEGDSYTGKEGKYNNGQWIDTALWFRNFPQMSIVNDEYVNYLASTRNTRNWSYQAAGWSQQKSLAGNQLTYDQANTALGTNQQNKNIQNIADAASTALSMAGAAAGGNVGGVLSAGLGSGINLVASNLQFQNNQKQGYAFAQQNKDLSDWASRGDYQNSIAQINAAVQDAALTQPSQSGQMSGDGFNLSNGLMVVQARYKTVDANHQNIIGNYWLRFGYAINEYVKPPADLKAMSHYTYWKMQDTTITCANADEGVKNTIRGIFEKGVTVWSKPEYIGHVWGATNEPVPGLVSYDRDINM